jgi:hypothetical protein
VSVQLVPSRVLALLGSESILFMDMMSIGCEMCVAGGMTCQSVLPQMLRTSVKSEVFLNDRSSLYLLFEGDPMKDERWILEKIEKNAAFDLFFPSGFAATDLPEWCNSKSFNKLGSAFLEPSRSMLGLELRAPLILSLSRQQKTVLAVVVLSFCRVAAPECFKPWHSLIIEVLSDIPHDALDFILRLLAFDLQFRHDFFSKSGSSVVVRSLATSFAIQVLPRSAIRQGFLVTQAFLQSPDKFVTIIKDILPMQYSPNSI